MEITHLLSTDGKQTKHSILMQGNATQQSKAKRCWCSPKHGWASKATLSERCCTRRLCTLWLQSCEMSGKKKKIYIYIYRHRVNAWLSRKDGEKDEWVSWARRLCDGKFWDETVTAAALPSRQTKKQGIARWTCVKDAACKVCLRKSVFKHRLQSENEPGC